MKQFVILVLMAFTISSCSSQNQIDIEQLSLNNMQMQSLMSDDIKYDKDWVNMWGLPNHFTYDTGKFRWGDIQLNKNDHMGRRNCLEIVMDSTNSHPMMIEIRLSHEETAKRLLEYLKNKYGEPVTLEEEHKPEELYFTAYLWKNVKEEQSIIWSIGYSYSKLDDRIDSSMSLYVIKNNTDIVGRDYDYNDLNVLEYFIQVHSRWSLEKIRKVLQE